MKDRTNNFTSSQIHKLVKKGGYDGFLKSGQTYIREKSQEYFLGRSLDTNVYTQAIAWGQLMEYFVYEKLEADYLHTQDRRFHNDLDWSGVPDFEIPDAIVSESKSYQLNRFASYSLCIKQKNIELLKSDFPAEYWQIVSNSVINKTEWGEAISYAPTIDELKEIAFRIEETDFLEQCKLDVWKFRFIVEKVQLELFNELACIPNDSKIPSLTRFDFKVPEADKDLLIERVTLAQKVKDKLNGN